MEETITKRYEGRYASQVEERFVADAGQAASAGWYPVSEQWVDDALDVTYARGRTPAPAPSAAARWASVFTWRSWLITAVLALLAGFAIGLLPALLLSHR